MGLPRKEERALHEDALRIDHMAEDFLDTPLFRCIPFVAIPGVESAQIPKRLIKLIRQRIDDIRFRNEPDILFVVGIVLGRFRTAMQGSAHGRIP